MFQQLVQTFDAGLAYYQSEADSINNSTPSPSQLQAQQQPQPTRPQTSIDDSVKSIVEVRIISLGPSVSPRSSHIMQAAEVMSKSLLSAQQLFISSMPHPGPSPSPVPSPVAPVHSPTPPAAQSPYYHPGTPRTYSNAPTAPQLRQQAEYVQSSPLPSPPKQKPLKTILGDLIHRQKYDEAFRYLFFLKPDLELPLIVIPGVV